MEVLKSSGSRDYRDSLAAGMFGNTTLYESGKDNWIKTHLENSKHLAALSGESTEDIMLPDKT